MIRILSLAVFCFGLGLAVPGIMLMLPACQPFTVFAIAAPETQISQLQLSAYNEQRELLLWQWQPKGKTETAAGFDIDTSFGDGIYRLAYRRQGSDETIQQDLSYISGRYFADDVLLLVGADAVAAHTLPRRDDHGWGKAIRLGTTLMPCLLR